MKRLVWTIVVILLITSLAAQGALAVSTFPVAAADTYVNAGSGSVLTHDGQGLSVTSGGLQGACNTIDTSFIRWDLTDFSSATVGTAIVTLTAFQATGLVVPVELTLYAVEDNTWDAATLVGPGPIIGGPLATATLPVTVSSTPLVFQSTLLSQFVKDKAGTAASFAVRMTTCGGAASPNGLLYDMENGSLTLASRASSAPSSTDAMTKPYMTIAPPTAITMSTFRAADPAVNWPLIIGLGALAAVVIGGAAVTRKRAAGR